MEIKVTRIVDGPAKVEVLSPEGECISSADVNAGQEVTITTSDNAENPPFIGEVCATATDTPGEEATQEPGGEAPASGGEESGGDTQV